MSEAKKRKFPTKADWIGMIVGFFPAAMIVSASNLPNSNIRIGAVWVFLIAMGGYYGAKAVAERFLK